MADSPLSAVAELQRLGAILRTKPIVQTSIGPIDATADDLALDFPNEDWDALMTARDDYHAAVSNYAAAVLRAAPHLIEIVARAIEARRLGWLHDRCDDPACLLTGIRDAVDVWEIECLTELSTSLKAGSADQ